MAFSASPSSTASGCLTPCNVDAERDYTGSGRRNGPRRPSRHTRSSLDRFRRVMQLCRAPVSWRTTPNATTRLPHAHPTVQEGSAVVDLRASSPCSGQHSVELTVVVFSDLLAIGGRTGAGRHDAAKVTMPVAAMADAVGSLPCPATVTSFRGGAEHLEPADGESEQPFFSSPAVAHRDVTHRATRRHLAPFFSRSWPSTSWRRARSRVALRV